MNDKLISTEIRGRKEIYYLTTKSDIEAIRSKSIFSDLFLALFSISLGVLATTWFTASSLTAVSELSIELSVYIKVFSAASIFLFILYVIFVFQNRKMMKSIVNSGIVTSLMPALDSTDELIIIEAFYYSLATKWDATKKLQSMVVNNQLNTYASNDLIGDPEPGQDKWLTIRYSIHGKEITKKYDQAELVNLP